MWPLGHVSTRSWELWVWALGHVSTGVWEPGVMWTLGYVSSGSRAHRVMQDPGHMSARLREHWGMWTLGHVSTGVCDSRFCGHWPLSLCDLYCTKSRSRVSLMARGHRVQISLTEFNLQLMKTGPSEQNSTFPGKGHSSTVLTICSLTLLLLADQELKTFIKNIYKKTTYYHSRSKQIPKHTSHLNHDQVSRIFFIYFISLSFWKWGLPWTFALVFYPLIKISILFTLGCLILFRNATAATVLCQNVHAMTELKYRGTVQCTEFVTEKNILSVVWSSYVPQTKDPETQSQRKRKRPRKTGNHREKDPEPRAGSVDPVASPHCHDFTGVSLCDEVVCNGF